MTIRTAAGVAMAICLLVLALSSACTGGSETSAADSSEQGAPAESAGKEPVNAFQEIATINPAIPLYQGAQYREDLSRRDQVLVRNRYGDDAEVFTLATDDSFPQVYHYYTTYLAQFRAFPAQQTFPPEGKHARTLEVKLNEAMQDPFIPGRALDPNGRQVTLQISETETEPKTVIRYIVTGRPAAPAAPVATASTNGAPAGPVTR